MQLRLPPGRRAQDAIAEIHFFTSRSYEWIVEGDIKACFDEISHSALLDRMRHRVGDKRVLGLVKAFLKSGILGEDGELRGLDYRHSPGRDTFARCSPTSPSRSLTSTSPRPGRRWETLPRPGATPAQGPCQLPPRPLRG